MKKVTTKTIQPQEKHKANKVQGLIFVVSMWLLSRLVVVVAMQLIAPSLNYPPTNHPYPPPISFTPNFVATPGWELFSHWDGKWYERIATQGYEYANDGQQHSVAFFPLFPLLARAVMTFGLPFNVAATLVNNLAFLGALVLLYLWAEERQGTSAARWATAVLAWCPFSLYGTVIYTEGLFLLLTTAALRAFDNRQYAWAALWGALATATRATGIVLVPAFLLVAWRERRPAIAYAAGLLASLGLLIFMLYCGIRFGDPLAFSHVQQAWEQPNWIEIFKNALTFSSREDVYKVIMVFGGGYLLWHLRRKLPSIAIAYGYCALALIIISGALSSVNRYAYAIVSLPFALGILFTSHPRWGYVVLGLFGIFLVRYAIQFTWWIWVA